MTRAALGLLTLGLVAAACDFEGAYRDYCARPDSGCLGASPDAGDATVVLATLTGAGVAGDTAVLTPHACDTRLTLRTAHLSGASAPAPFDGGLRVRVIPPVGLELTPVGPCVAGDGGLDLSFTAGAGLERTFALRATHAGSWVLDVDDQAGLAAPGLINLRVPSALRLAGVPTRFDDASACAGPLRVALTDLVEGGLLRPNAERGVTFEVDGGRLFSAPSCSAASAVAAVTLSPATPTSGDLFLGEVASGATVQLVARTDAGEVASAVTTRGGGLSACVAAGDYCLVDAGAFGPCCTGECLTAAGGLGRCPL